MIKNFDCLIKMTAKIHPPEGIWEDEKGDSY